MAAIQGALAGIEPRIAQATCDRLKPEMCTDVTDGTGEVQGGPLALLVKSNFTLLFENARLDENGDVSERSAGIRLTPAHQRRLDAIVRNGTSVCRRRHFRGDRPRRAQSLSLHRSEIGRCLCVECATVHWWRCKHA